MPFSHLESEEHFFSHKVDHCLVMIFNRPEKYNAFTLEMYHQLAKAYYQIESDPEIRCGLLIARGKNFTAGLELEKWIGSFSTGKPEPLPEDEIDPFGITGKKLSKPIIMATQGICFTVGLELMLNTDIRLCTPDCRFAQLEVKRGIYPCGGATIRLPKEIGWTNAQRYLMTGEEFNGEDAYRMGLVQQLEPLENLHQAAFDIAQRVCKVAPLAVQVSLKSSKLAHYESQQKAFDTLYEPMATITKSEDAKEGVQSFLERREAVFKGK